jgi:DNA-binding transcriptional regulator YhcF (GntR family)
VDAAREVAAEHFLNYKKVQEQLEELKKAGFVPSDEK